MLQQWKRRRRENNVVDIVHHDLYVLGVLQPDSFFFFFGVCVCACVCACVRVYAFVHVSSAVCKEIEGSVEYGVKLWPEVAAVEGTVKKPCPYGASPFFTGPPEEAAISRTCSWVGSLSAAAWSAEDTAQCDAHGDVTERLDRLLQVRCH